MPIAYLGPEGSYTHIAARNNFGLSESLIAFPNITAIVKAVEDGKCSQGIIPVENSIAGGVHETIDALMNAENIFVNQEYILPIDHCLLALAAEPINDFTRIQTIRANQITFNQCSEFLYSRCPNAELIPSASNSAAAKWLQKTQDQSAAVIASKLCSEIYNLQILAEKINDGDINETRFWIVSGAVNDELSTKNKTTIVFRTVDEPGSLQTILRLFAVNHVNLSRIESRPARRNIGEYLFLVDFDLHREDPRYDELMRQVSRHLTYYKWLGSYNKL